MHVPNGLRAQHREKIPGCLNGVRPAPLARSTQIDVELLKECCVGEVRALLAPFVELLRAVVGRKPHCSAAARRSGSRKGSERSSSALTTLKTPVFAPMPMARARMANPACHGRRAQSRRVYLAS